MFDNQNWFLSRRFFPIFTVQALGAFADNLIKTVLTFLIAYGGLTLGTIGNDMALLLAAAALVAPFVVLSGYAGALADKFDKRRLIIGTRLLEVGLACFALLGFYGQFSELLLLVLIGYGAQSALFGPVKFASLPVLVGKRHLLSANAFFEASTFIAILLGVIVGGVFGNDSALSLYAGFGLVMTAIFGFIMAWRVPSMPPEVSSVPVRVGLWHSTVESLKSVTAVKSVFHSVIGLAYFWAVGLVVVTLFPEAAQTTLNITAEATTFLLVAFVVGIGAGSLAIAFWLKGQISARFAPLGLFLMALGLAGLGLAIETFDMALADGTMIGPLVLLVSADGWFLFVAMAFVAFAGGIFTVPLYAIIQADSPADASARAIAGNNIITGLVMMVLVGITTLLNMLGLTFIDFIYVFSLLSFFATLCASVLVPLECVKWAIGLIVRGLFRLEIRGLEHMKANEPRVIVANHVSLLDGLVLCSCLPGPMSIAVHKDYIKGFWVRFGKLFFDIVEVDLDGRVALKTMINAAKVGRSVLIFPEGRITTTGALERIMPGAATVAMLGKLPILPVRIQGFEQSKLSRMQGKMTLRWLPKGRITITAPVRLVCPAGYIGKAARLWAEQRLGQIMVDMMAETEHIAPTIFEAFIEASRLRGKGVILEDSRARMTYRRLLVAAFALGRVLSPHASDKGRIGLMLPTSVGAAVSFFGCLAYGRVPTMINFTSGPGMLVHAARLSQISTVVTSRFFIEQARLEGHVDALGEVVRIVYLEDIRAALSWKDRLAALISALMPKRAWRKHIIFPVKADDEAVLMFTSGSDGAPKGVSLSHANLLANYCQVKSVIGLDESDRVMSVLPVFHAFGLYISFVLAVLIGARTFLYPSPLHTKVIPALCYDWNATIFFAADTFLANYARVANPYDFRSLRLVVAGAERLKPQTRALWSRRFGVRILEGYGATETSPVISVNTPLHNREGTVGRSLPGIECKIEPVEGIEEGGRLLVRGPNIMRGYIDPEQPEGLVGLRDGWYDTGDIVTQDHEGYVTIKGRVKRFAKVGGEMVSLAQIEALASSIWPDDVHAAVAVPHPRKGEQVVLFSETLKASLKAYKQANAKAGLADVAVPSAIILVDNIPVLGSGKIDYATLKQKAEHDSQTN